MAYLILRPHDLSCEIQHHVDTRIFLWKFAMLSLSVTPQLVINGSFRSSKFMFLTAAIALIIRSFRAFFQAAFFFSSVFSASSIFLNGQLRYGYRLVLLSG